MGFSENGICERCEKMEETAEHYLCKCSGHANLRLRTFGGTFCDPKTLLRDIVSQRLNHLSLQTHPICKADMGWPQRFKRDMVPTWL